MANIFKKLFGYKDKRDTSYTGARPQSISEMPSYQSARDLLSTYGTPESYRDKYYRDIFQPTATQARADWESYTEPTISGRMSGMGMGRSTMAADLLRRSAQEREMGLAKLGGDLRARGYETGLGERGKQLAGYQSLIGPEQAQDAARVGFDQWDYGQQLKIADERRKAQQEAIQRAVMAVGGAVAGGAAGGFGLTPGIAAGPGGFAKGALLGGAGSAAGGFDLGGIKTVGDIDNITKIIDRLLRQKGGGSPTLNEEGQIDIYG